MPQTSVPTVAASRSVSTGSPSGISQRSPYPMTGTVISAANSSAGDVCGSGRAGLRRSGASEAGDPDAAHAAKKNGSIQPTSAGEPVP